MPKPFEMPYLSDEPERYRLFDHGEWAGSCKTAEDVWARIKDWEIGRERIYDSDRIISRSDIEKAISASRKG